MSMLKGRVTTPAPREHGSRVIAAVETAWAAIRAQHPDVPLVVAITGRGDYGDITWGHFATATWHVGEGQVAELFTAGELLALGGRRVMQTLLHEAAHGLADVRGIQDTSNKHRYHNKKFVRLAVELGLKPPAEKDDVIGWSECRITDATAARYKDAIAALEAEKLPYRRSAWVSYLRKWGDEDVGGGQASGLGGEVGGEPTPVTVVEGGDEDVAGPVPPEPVAAPAGRDGVRILIACACVPPRKMQSSPAAFERGPVSCGVCETDFVQAEPKPRRRRMPRER